MKNMIKVSVIVPVYNAEKYLRACVDSILAQTVTELECILVDDGSTDASPTICDEYAARDSRVKVIHKPNGRASSARNAGIRAARGEYIAFVDSDDWIAPDMYEKMLEPGADVCLCDYVRFSEEVERPFTQPNVSGGFYNKDQMRMYRGIVSATKNKIVNNPDFVGIIPSGTAIQNLRTSGLGDTLTADGYHLKDTYGDYTAALTWFCMFSGRPATSMSYRPATISDYFDEIAESVDNALKTPFAVTKCK